MRSSRVRATLPARRSKIEQVELLDRSSPLPTITPGQQASRVAAHWRGAAVVRERVPANAAGSSKSSRRAQHRRGVRGSTSQLRLAGSHRVHPAALYFRLTPVSGVFLDPKVGVVRSSPRLQRNATKENVMIL